MKIRCLLIVFLFITGELLARETIIPYEIDNKIGFLNENLEVIHYPQFDSLSLCFAKQCIAFKRGSDGLLNQYVITSERIIRKPKEAINCVVIGDDYYGFVYNIYKDPITGIKGTVLYSHNNSEKIIFNDIELNSSMTSENIPITDIKNKPRYNFISLSGKKKFVSNNDLFIKDFNFSLNRGVIRKEFNDYLVDEDLNLISNKNYGFYYGFSNDGLILGESDRGEKVFFDINGNLSISISRVPEMYIGFCCNRIPVVINKNGEYELYSEEDCYSDNWAIIDGCGNIIKNHISADLIYGYSADGIAILRKYEGNQSNYYLINIDGEKIMDNSFDFIQPFNNGYARAKKSGKDYLISSKDYKIYECKDFY